MAKNQNINLLECRNDVLSLAWWGLEPTEAQDIGPICEKGLLTKKDGYQFPDSSPHLGCY